MGLSAYATQTRTLPGRRAAGTCTQVLHNPPDDSDPLRRHVLPVVHERVQVAPLLEQKRSLETKHATNVAAAVAAAAVAAERVGCIIPAPPGGKR